MATIDHAIAGARCTEPRLDGNDLARIHHHSLVGRRGRRHTVDDAPGVDQRGGLRRTPHQEKRGRETTARH
jgi:hypothetical protein